MADPIVYGWHWLPADGRCRYDGRPVKPGETLSVEGEVVPCHNGLHASACPLDALGYVGGWLRACRVAVWGDLVDHGDKIVGRHRHCLWLLDEETTERVLREHACRCATRALKWAYWERGEEPDPRSVAAILVAERCARGEASEEDLDAAWEAAWEARAAARAATTTRSSGGPTTTPATPTASTVDESALGRSKR